MTVPGPTLQVVCVAVMRPVDEEVVVEQEDLLQLPVDVLLVPLPLSVTPSMLRPVAVPVQDELPWYVEVIFDVPPLIVGKVAE